MKQARSVGLYTNGIRRSYNEKTTYADQWFTRLKYATDGMLDQLDQWEEEYR